MLHNLTGWHALIVLAIIILVFGAAKLPALAKSLGRSMRILKDEASDPRGDDKKDNDKKDNSKTADQSANPHEAVTDPIAQRHS